MSRYREAKLQKMTVRAMETLPGLFLGLSTGALGDSDEPIVLDGAGAGPADELLRHPETKYFGKGNPRC